MNPKKEYRNRDRSVCSPLLKHEGHRPEIDTHRVRLTEQVHPEETVLEFISYRLAEDIGRAERSIQATDPQMNLGKPDHLAISGASDLRNAIAAPGAPFLYYGGEVP